MYEDLNVYSMRKLIYTVIFNFFENDYEDAEDFDLLVIESLRNIVEYLSDKNYLSDSVKNNIHNYLTRARDFEDEKRSKRIEFINEIIGFMNAQEKDESDVFYKLELFKRRRSCRYIVDCNEDDIKAVHDSICNDFYVIISRTHTTDDETFKTEYLPYFKDSPLYYESLNAILYENPTVFKDELFYSRMMQVINLNKELYKDDKLIQKVNKNMLNKINKTIKKLNKKYVKQVIL